MVGVGLGAGLGDEVVERGAVVPLVVVAALAAEQRAQEVVRVRIVRAPGVTGDRVDELGALDDERVEGHALQLALDAEVLAPLLLHVRRGDLVTGVGVEAERQGRDFADVLVAKLGERLVQLLLGAVDVVLEPDVVPGGRACRAGSGYRRPCPGRRRRSAIMVSLSMAIDRARRKCLLAVGPGLCGWPL